MKNWLFIFFVFSKLTLAAQIDTLSFIKETKTDYPFKIAYKVPVFSWLDITSPSVNFGVELSLSKKISLHQEIGYINYRINKLFYEMEARKVQGFKLSFEPRFYVKNKNNRRLFLAGSVFYKYDNEFIKDAHFWRHNGQYIQLIDYNRIRNLIAFTPKIGFQFLKKNKAVGFEFSTGLGIRMLKISYAKNDVPEDASLSNRFSGNFFLKREEGSYFRPNLFIGLSIIFRDKNNR